MVNLKKRINQGERIIGTMINVIDTLDIASIFKACSFDYIIIDNEHGAMEYSKVAAMISLCNEMDLGVIIRIPETRREFIQKYLDMGADGIMIPNCDTADEARLLVKYAKYSPEGQRGVSLMRGHNRYYQVKSPLDFMKEQNDRTILIVQIESPSGVENIDEILSVEGVDVALVGPNDLSASLGIMGEVDNPVYIEAVEKVISSAKEHSKFGGIQGLTPLSLKEWINKGMQVILYSNEVQMLLASKSAVKTIAAYECNQSQ
jgi:2-dehydro-3-deoxyglucarate aldolase/4-hydroxy-2-oxoheptanedioate aldolase